MLSGKLAACVNIIPGITSVYEWQGKVIDTGYIIVNLPSHFFVSSIGLFFFFWGVGLIIVKII